MEIMTGRQPLVRSAVSQRIASLTTQRWILDDQVEFLCRRQEGPRGDDAPVLVDHTQQDFDMFSMRIFPAQGMIGWKYSANRPSSSALVRRDTQRI